MIHRLTDLIGNSEVTQSVKDDRGYTMWARAVPRPFQSTFKERLLDAYAVLFGQAIPVRWPEAGELERALYPDYIIRRKDTLQPDE